MKQFKTIEKPVEELEALTCNKCGVTAIVRGDGLDSLSALHQFQSFEMSFGYGSNFDEEIWSFDLCEDCLEKFVSTFKIKPDVRNY